MSGHWFEKHPKKSLALLLLVILLLIIFASEKILQYKNKGMGFNYNLPHRAIRLREYRPTMIESVRAGKQQINYDSLAPKDYILRIDDDGFIMPSKKYPDPDISLAFLGGSTTECHLMEEEHRFPYLTGLLIEQQLGIKINSFNAARSGNDSLHSLDILLNKLMPIKPDIVIMMHNINDLSILLHEKSYWNKNKGRSVIIDINEEIVSNYFKVMRDKLIPNLAAALHKFDTSMRMLWRSSPKRDDEFAPSRGQTLAIDKAGMVEQFEMNLQSFIYLCQARHIVPILMTMASRFKEKPDAIILNTVKDVGVEYKDFKELFDQFNDSIRTKARENHIMLIDLAQEIPPEKEFLYDVVHFNDTGSIKTAKVIAEQLTPVVKQVPAKPRH